MGAWPCSQQGGGRGDHLHLHTWQSHWPVPAADTHLSVRPTQARRLALGMCSDPQESSPTRWALGMTPSSAERRQTHT